MVIDPEGGLMTSRIMDPFLVLYSTDPGKAGVFLETLLIRHVSIME
jgi:hypothetical protein